MNVFDKLWTWVFRQTKVGQALDGNKTYIGLVLLALAYLSKFAAEAVLIVPEWEFLSATALTLSEFLSFIAPYLEKVGIAGISVGLVDDKIKRRD